MLPLFVALALAQTPEPTPQPETPPSVAEQRRRALGTWEAGYVYLLLEQLKVKRTHDVKVVSGASAGSANALVAALSSCRPVNPNPLADPGWRAWGEIGFAQLFDKKSRSSESLFTRGALEQAFARLGNLFEEGLEDGCDVVLGVVVTRVAPRTVELQKGFAVPRVEEKFLVRITGRGVGKRPLLRNYANPAAYLPQPLLPFIDDKDGTDAEAWSRNFGRLRGLLFASTAFPVAFAPQAIEYCLSTPPRDGVPADLTCTEPRFVDLFVDGGVFDNNPLRLAYTVADNRLDVSSARPLWREDVRISGPSPEVLHLSMDPDTVAYPPEDPDAPTGPSRGMLDQVFALTGGFVENARAKELYTLAQEKQELSQRMRLSVGYFPKASEPLNAFLGFFDADFRLYDFYLGMYDAYRELKTGGWLGEKYDVDALVASHVAVAPEAWKPFECLLGMFEPGHESQRAACTSGGMEAFAILTQVSLDRLYAACRPRAQQLASQLGYHYHCTQARDGVATPRVPGVRDIGAASERKEGESAYAYELRLLGEYGYPFQDLSLARKRPHEGGLAVRRELERVVYRWSASQPTFAEQLLAKTAGRVALNNIEFSPPVWSAYAVLGTVIESGMSLVPFGWDAHWLQFTAALELTSFFSLFTPAASQRFATLLMAGPEFHLSFLSGAIVQPRIALRGGLQLGIADGLATQKCDTTVVDPRSCTQAAVETVFILPFFDRLRVQLAWQMFPQVAGAMNPRWFNLHFGVGVQFF
jgi:predicted acylesterase/phospholipase RssA